MCGIFASRDKMRFYELAAKNSYRGSHSHSISYYDGNKIQVMTKGLGEMPEIDLEDGYYYIGHVQAPTTDVSDENIHPAFDKGDYLWHNGIILNSQIKKWQESWKEKWTWDTYFMLWNMNSGPTEDILSETKGSFACVWYGKYQPSLTAFRNDNSPLFYTEEGDLSSTKTDNSLSLDSGVFYSLSKDKKWVKTEKVFKTKDEFYWSPK
tara:strand:+ start:871 stop:1494 length:624 start_codon:yes stop_codon:yes gene_type:complete